MREWRSCSVDKTLAEWAEGVWANERAMVRTMQEGSEYGPRSS